MNYYHKPSYCLNLSVDVQNYINSFIKHPLQEAREFHSKNLFYTIAKTLRKSIRLYDNHIVLHCLSELYVCNMNPQNFRFDTYFNRIKSIYPSNVMKYSSGLMLKLGCLDDDYHALLTQIRLYPVVRELNF